MIEEIIKTGISNLFSQGVLGTVLVLSWILFVFVWRMLWKRIDKAETLCSTERIKATEEYKAQFEKRLEDGKEVLTALNRASIAMDGLKLSVDARATAMNELTTGFARFVTEAKTGSDRWQDFRRQIEQFQSDALNRLNDLASRLRSR